MSAVLLHVDEKAPIDINEACEPIPLSSSSHALVAATRREAALDLADRARVQVGLACADAGVVFVVVVFLRVFKRPLT